MESPFSKEMIVKIVDSAGVSFNCQYAEGVHLNLNARFQWLLELSLPYLINRNLFKHCTLELSGNNTLYRIDCDLLSFKIVKQSDDNIQYELCLGSPLFRLDNCSAEGVFVEESIDTIIKKIFSAHHMYPILQGSRLQEKLPYYTQAGASDYDFFLRICAEFGLIFYHRFTERESILKVSDSTIDSISYHLPFNPGNNLVNESPSITALQYEQQTIPIVKKDPECRAFWGSDQSDWRRESIIIETQGIFLQCGDLLQMEGHPNDKTQGLFQVIHAKVSISENEDETAHPFRQALLLMPAEAQYWLPAIMPSFNYPKPYLQLGWIEGNGNECLDENGCYHIRFWHDCSSGGKEKNSPPLRLMQPYACPVKSDPNGMHFPLAAGTHVIVGHLEGDVNNPFIVGMLPSKCQPTPVNEENPSQLIIRQQNGASVFFDENKNNQRVALQTTPLSHGLFFNKDNENEQVLGKSMDYMLLQSHEDMCWSTGNDLIIQTQQSQLQAGEELSVMVKDSLECFAKLGLLINIDNDCQLKSKEGDLLLNGHQTLHLQSDVLQVNSTGFEIKTNQVSAKAQKKLNVKCAGNIKLESMGSELHLSPATIHFMGSQIALSASQVIKNLLL